MNRDQIEPDDALPTISPATTTRPGVITLEEIMQSSDTDPRQSSSGH